MKLIDGEETLREVNGGELVLTTQPDLLLIE